MAAELDIDQLDRKILAAMIEDARTSYAVMAKRFYVSPATIHVRVDKLRRIGLIKGTTLRVDRKMLGYDVTCFIGITLRAAKDYVKVREALIEWEEVLEAHYTTGQFNLFVKVMTRSIEALQRVLVMKIQTIEEVQSTETIIVLETSLQREVNPLAG